MESATFGAAYIRVFHCDGRACKSCWNSRAVCWRVWLRSGREEVSSSCIARGCRKPGMARYMVVDKRKRCKFNVS